jgi:16S rRNA (cytosine967-C5)-methyltransferase
MKYHKPLVAAVVNAIQLIFDERQYADKVVERVLKSNPQFGSRDRRFIAETIYEMVRWWRLIDEVVKRVSPRNSKNYHIHFAAWQLLNNNLLPDWQEFKDVNEQEIKSATEELKKERAIRESYPDWLDSLLANELGEQVWEKEAAALNQEAAVFLRVNTLKSTNSVVLDKLKAQDVELEKCDWNGLQQALKLKKRKNVQSFAEYKSGFFEIQDASSQLIAPFLNPTEGSFVIDACAGAGGKTLHLASIMNNKGSIVAMDVEENKLIELKKRADRAGVKIVKTACIASDTVNKYKNTADFLLMDVPCSGLGTLKRVPDAKWKLSAAFIEQIKQTQQKILREYSQMLKPGGTMVYATCSILPSENQQQIQTFLNETPQLFEFISDKKILPSEGADGFYMAMLKKKY